MIGIVWYKDKNKGRIKFNQLYNDYKKFGLKPQYKNDYCFIAFNKDIWYLISANTQSRGNCCNLSFIDKNIDKKIIDAIIKPSLKRHPYQMYQYY